MKIKLTLLLMLWTGSIPALVSQTILMPPDLANGDNFGRNVSIHEHRIVASTNNFNELNTVHAFQKTGAQWEYDGELMPGDLTLSDEYGRDLDVYGDYAVVGAPSASGQGKAYVFHRTGDQQWTMMQALQSADIAAGDDFGIAVDIYETTILVGASGKSSGKGAAYFFELDNGTWMEKAKVTVTVPNSSLFGHYLSLDGDYAAICAHQAETVFVFKRDGDAWNNQQTLDSPDGNNNSFGVTASIRKDRLLVGSLRDDQVANDAGAAYVYKRTGDSWSLEQKLTASDGSDGRNFGGRISLSEHYACIGTLYDINFNTGATYIFKRDGTTWNEVEKYTTGQNDYFGWATDIVGNVAVVGAYAATGGGAVYVYDLPEVVSAFEAGRPALELNVYPNPARDALWVDLPADWQESEFALFSADGRIVRTWKQGHGQPISLQELPTGAYFLKVQFGEAIGLARFRKF